MTPALADASWHERRLARRLEARGEAGHVEALLGLKGVIVGGRHRIESLYAVGGEGAVYLTRDLRDSDAPQNVAKVALLPVHRPFRLDARAIRKQRDGIRLEATYLKGSGSRFLPRYEGLHEFQNPLLDRARGGAFGESEPLLLMEKLPGMDLDRWLARMHRSEIPRTQMRRTLDRVAVVLLQALVDLYDRGFFYADLRPANLRVMGRPERMVRLLDAGSLVPVQDKSGRFPHVPSYLPEELFRQRIAGHPIVPAAGVQAIMAGRTLYEVATGRVPRPGERIEREHLVDSNVSPPVAEVVEGLCQGDFVHVRHAYRFLAKRASRRVSGGNDPTKLTQHVPEAPAMPAPASEPSPPLQTSVSAPRSASPPPPAVSPNPGPAPRRGLWARIKRLFGG
jgi:hypothetical protein